MAYPVAIRFSNYGNMRFAKLKPDQGLECYSGLVETRCGAAGGVSIETRIP